MSEPEQGPGAAARMVAAVRGKIPAQGAYALFSVVATAAVMTLGCLVLARWLVRVDIFASASVTHEPMTVTTAVCLVLLSGACWVLNSPPRTAGRRFLTATLAAAAGSFAVLGSVRGVEPRLERFLARADVGDLIVAPDARVGPVTVVAIVALSAAAVAVAVGTPKSMIVCQTAAVVAIVVGVLTLYARVYLGGGNGPRGVGLTATALHTSVALVVVGVILIGVRPDTGLARILTGDAASAVMGRRMLAAAVTVPFALGWLRLFGQNLGLYTTATGTTLLVTANAVTFAAVGFFSALRVAHLEAARQQTELVIRERARTQTLIDNIPAVMFMKDHRGRFQLVNNEFERVTGLERRHVVGLTVDDIFPAEIATQMRAHDDQTVEADAPVQAEEVLPGPRGDRTYLTVRFPLAGGDGAAVCGVGTDITERLHAAAEHEKLQQRLRRTERLETLGQLAGGIAHDFNNLLASVLGRAELMRDAQPGDVRADADAIVRAAERGAGLTRQLLVFSQTQSGHAEAIPINSQVTEIADALRTTLPKNIHLVTRIPPDPLITPIAPAHLDQVLTNLVGNACTAMPDGGRLSIEIADTHIEPDHQPDPDAPVGHFLRLTVTDTGCGMTSEVADHAFDPFFTTHAEGSGRGLGLTTVYGIAKQAGGDVTLWSREQGGTIARVYLPAAGYPARSPERAAGAASPGSHGGRILVVDDEDGVREIVARILTKHGYEVLTADSGADAIRQWQDRHSPVDILITDLVMPGMSGSQLAERLRADRPGLPVLFMSGYTSSTLPPGNELPDRTTLLHKPFERAALLTALRAALDPTSVRSPASHDSR